MSSSTAAISVFLLVMFGFLLTQTVMTVLEERQSLTSPKNIPLLYRIAFSPISLLGILCGKALSASMPEQTRKLEKTLVLADLDLTPQQVYGAQFFYAVVMFFLVLFYSVTLPVPGPIKFLIALALLFVGWEYPVIKIDSAADDRQQELIRSLPYAIDLVGSAMRSGLEFGAALRYYVNLNLPTPLTKEFRRMLEENGLGKTRAEALTAMAERLQIPEFTSFVNAIAHGMEVGASISDSLAIQGEELRRARFNLAEQKAAKAPSKMLFPMMLFIMPAVFLTVAVPVYIRVRDTGLLATFGH